MKEAVAQNPAWVGARRRAEVEVEDELPSGDRIDVLFHEPLRDLAVEVKTSQASVLDVKRGLFQCVKYEAVLVAVAKVDASPRSCESVLALGGELPSELVPVMNLLGVRVLENVGNGAF